MDEVEVLLAASDSDDEDSGANGAQNMDISLEDILRDDEEEEGVEQMLSHIPTTAPSLYCTQSHYLTQSHNHTQNFPLV